MYRRHLTYRTVTGALAAEVGLDIVGLVEEALHRPKQVDDGSGHRFRVEDGPAVLLEESL